MVAILNLSAHAKNHPGIRWVQFRGNISIHSWEIDCRRLGSIRWWTQRMTLWKITEQRVAFTFCVAEGTFSLNYKKLKRSRNYFWKHCKRVLCHCLSNMSESWFWMGFVVGNRFVVEFLSKDKLQIHELNKLNPRQFLSRKKTKQDTTKLLTL